MRPPIRVTNWRSDIWGDSTSPHMSLEFGERRHDLCGHSEVLEAEEKKSRCVILVVASFQEN